MLLAPGPVPQVLRTSFFTVAQVVAVAAVEQVEAQALVAQPEAEAVVDVAAVAVPALALSGPSAQSFQGPFTP